MYPADSDVTSIEHLMIKIFQQLIMRLIIKLHTPENSILNYQQILYLH